MSNDWEDEFREMLGLWSDEDDFVTADEDELAYLEELLSVGYSSEEIDQLVKQRRKSKKLEPYKCICDSRTIFNKGCQCGGI